MAKFQRLGPVWRKPKPLHWKKQKNLARWANERQGFSENNPLETAAIEIETAEGWYILLEQSGATEADYIFVGTE